MKNIPTAQLPLKKELKKRGSHCTNQRNDISCQIEEYGFLQAQTVLAKVHFSRNSPKYTLQVLL